MTVVVLLAATGLAIAEEKLTLRLNLQPGTTYTSTIDMTNAEKQGANGEEQMLTNEMLWIWDYAVLDKDMRGNTDIRLIYKRVKLIQDFGGQRFEYDSDNPPEFLDPSMKSMASLIGSDLYVNLTPEGKVLNVEGIDSLLDRTISAMDLPESPQKDVIIDNLKKQFGYDAMKQALEQITAFYPQNPVAVGDRWKSDVNLTSGFPMRIISNYALKSRENGRAEITVSSEILSDPASNKMTMGPLTMAYDIRGGQTGSIQADEATGLPLNSTLNLDFTGTVTVSGVPDHKPTTYPISASGTVGISFAKQ
jgi:hypothetical protein